MKKILLTVLAVLFVGGGILLATNAAFAQNVYGPSSGCSGLSLEFAAFGVPIVGDILVGTMGNNALNSVANTDGGGLNDALEECICDALADVGVICAPAAPSSDYEGNVALGAFLTGKKRFFTVTFTAVGP